MFEKYKLEATTKDKNEDGTIKEDVEPYLLRDLMANCADFQEEMSAMQYLSMDIDSVTTAVRIFYESDGSKYES